MYGQEYVATTWVDGQHEHDHPRHGGDDRDWRHLQEPQVPRQQSDSKPSTASSPIRCGIRTGSRKRTTTPTNWAASHRGPGFPGAQSADWGWAQHILASLNGTGRAAIVLDTGAASRGSGNANKNKERAIRQWFVEQDLIEGVIYLPENLFYNTNSPGILLFLNKAKPKYRKGRLFLVNASQVVEKGDPKNFIPAGRRRTDRAGLQRVA